jgi:hypothetical protein
MIDHDRSRRVGHGGFAHRGTGHQITRTYDRCGKHMTFKGGTWHRVLGWIGECCSPQQRKDKA